MTDHNMMLNQRQFQLRAMENAQQRQFESMVAQQQQQKQQQQQTGSWPHPTMMAMAMGGALSPTFDDLPLMHPTDLGFGQEPPAFFKAYGYACRNGPISTVQSTISSDTRTPAFLHYGLKLALQAGNIETANYLLSAGAPIVRQTPPFVLSAPPYMQIPLFELLVKHGWTPNTPGYYGAVLLPLVTTNMSLLTWFLEHGANPNLGTQPVGPYCHRDQMGDSDPNSCDALETAAKNGKVEAVRMLLNAGAKVQNGSPLYYAAGVCIPSPHSSIVTPSKEFDVGQIPIMELLVEHGADVNQKLKSPYMEPGYALLKAVMAGAVERVKWLVDRGANPVIKGPYGSALEYAESNHHVEMQKILEEAVTARKWVDQHDSPTS